MLGRIFDALAMLSPAHREAVESLKRSQRLTNDLSAALLESVAEVRDFRRDSDESISKLHDGICEGINLFQENRIQRERIQKLETELRNHEERTIVGSLRGKESQLQRVGQGHNVRPGLKKALRSDLRHSPRSRTRQRSGLGGHGTRKTARARALCGLARAFQARG